MKASKVLNKDILYNHKVNKLSTNSKNIEENDIFFAIKGSKEDGNNYIEEAVRNGAKTVVTENTSTNIKVNNINVIIVKDINKYLAECAKIYYKDISKKIKLIGVTGTNGKTSTATLVYKYLRSINLEASLISTGKIYINDKSYENHNTTPDILTIYNVIKESVNNGCKYVVMEVSSHGVKLNRICGLSFEISAITNITHDHLDFHKSFEDYKFSKMFFLSKGKFPIINNSYKTFLPYYNNNCITYGEKINDDNIDYEIKNIDEKINGVEFDLLYNNKLKHFKTTLLAKFNVYNITLFIAIINALSLYDDKAIDDFFNKKQNIEGRLEVINDNPKIIIDFAHTPDAVNKVLSYLNNFKKEGKIITVIGMGGNRDKDKRKDVGKIVCKKSDIAIFTEDNSRNEKVEDIIENIISEVSQDNYLIIYDRLEAIEKALLIANENDIICILGRGSEQYLESNNIKRLFKDKDIVLSLIH